MTISAQDVLLALFNPSDTVCFRVFDDKKGGVFTGAKFEMEAGKYTAIEGTLKNHNDKNHGVFFVVNHGGQDDNSITRINAQFVEMDDLSFEDQQKAVDAFPLPPSMVIKTRKSLHVYWFVINAKVELFRPIQKQLVAHFHGDPMCVNESRVMRLPSFYHCKQEPVMVECLSFHPERKYTQEQLIEVLPEIEQQAVETKKGVEKGIELLLYGCDFIKHCRVNAGELSESYFTAEFSRRVGDKEEEAFFTGNGVKKPLGVLADEGGAEIGVTTASATAITADDIIDLFYSLKAPYRKNAIWVLNDSTVAAVRKLKDENGQYMWQPALHEGGHETLLGKKIYTSPFMPELKAGQKPILFGNFTYYWIGDRTGITFKRLNERYADTGQVGFLATKRLDGKLILSEAVKVLKMKSA